MINKIIVSVLIPLVGLVSSCATTAQNEENKSYGERALEESAIPVRPGIPGERPFWNGYSKRFIYAPAFDFKEVENSELYKFELVALEDSTQYSFESKKPYDPLSPVWTDLPVGSYNLLVTGISEGGDILSVAGKREFYRAASFDGIYHETSAHYDSSARVALSSLLHKDYLEYWLEHKAPDPSYVLYRYPSKIYSALVIGAVSHARLTEGTPEAERSVNLARIIADNLLSISFKEGTPLEFFPPTYHGYDKIFDKKPDSHMQHEHNMITYAADAGNAYLDLYDLTGDQKYLQAAKNIANTYLKTQLENGSWYLYVSNKTGDPIEEPLTIPTEIINYFDRLRGEYNVEGLEEATRKALAYTMDNPVKTFDWHGQFEDVKARKPYQNLSREQACNLAMYLFRNNSSKENIELAEELLRFSEDQFVIWEKPEPLLNSKRGPGGLPQNWITPSVQEQYVFWRPIARSSGIMIETFWEAYKASGEEIYLAKAKSLANTFLIVQEMHNGDYPTHFTKHKMNFWLNNVVYPAKVLMNFENNMNP
ncbi:MAG: hypothetical protein WD555_03305 [Fulvivirga sp.]